MTEEIIHNSFAHFGDGNTSLILRKRKYIGEDGITYWEFLFRPGDRIIGIYGIKSEINSVDGSVKRDYPATEVTVTDENPGHYRIWIYCDFEGNPTPASRLDDEKDFQILNLQKMKATMELEISELHQMLQRRTSPDAFIEQAAELVKKARGAGAKKLPGSEEDIEGDEE